MIDLILRSAETSPEHPAVVGESSSLTYGQLVDQARIVAANLRARGITQAALAEDDIVTSIALLVGCAYAGVEVCVTPRAATDEAVLSTVERLGEPTLISSRTAPELNAVATAEILQDNGADPGEPAEDGLVLVLTSGTSGYPRAARHLWSRVTQPLRGTRPTPEHHWVLSYGLNQFGGLQVLLHVFTSGATLYVPESLQPRHASRLLGPWGITHASGTPTFWRFVLLELANAEVQPPLAQITLGGEAVPAPLLAQLRERFPDAKISQIYGATEFGVNITVRDGLPGLPVSLLTANDHIQFDVRDGELWVRSKNSMLGYRDAASGDAEQDLDPAEWRATGDLVEVVGDRVLFRGRKSEVINVGGVKVHPLPIEERIAGVEGVALVHVNGRPNPVVGSVVAARMVLAPGYDPDTVIAAAREACADLPPSGAPAQHPGR